MSVFGTAIAFFIDVYSEGGEVMKDTFLFSIEEIKLILAKYHERCTGEQIEVMSGQSLMNLFEAINSKDVLQYLYCHMH